MRTVGPPRDCLGYPESRSGGIAVSLIAIALGAGGFLAAAHLLIDGMFADHPVIDGQWTTFPLATLALCGILAAIAAMVAYVVEQERSVFVGLAFVVGLMITHISINGL